MEEFGARYDVGPRERIKFKWRIDAHQGTIRVLLPAGDITARKATLWNNCSRAGFTKRIGVKKATTVENKIEMGLIDDATLIRALYKQPQQSDPPGKRVGGKFAALIISGRLQPYELETIIKKAERERHPVENVLMNQKELTKVELGAALSAYYQCPFQEYDEKLLIAPECVSRFSFT